MGFDIAFGFEVALGFAASVPQSIGRCRLFSQLPLGPFARSAQVNDIAHPAPDEPLLGLVPARGFGAKCAHSVAAGPGVSSRPKTQPSKQSGYCSFQIELSASGIRIGSVGSVLRATAEYVLLLRTYLFEMRRISRPYRSSDAADVGKIFPERFCTNMRGDENAGLHIRVDKRSHPSQKVYRQRVCSVAHVWCLEAVPPRARSQHADHSCRALALYFLRTLFFAKTVEPHDLAAGRLVILGVRCRLRRLRIGGDGHRRRDRGVLL